MDKTEGMRKQKNKKQKKRGIEKERKDFSISGGERRRGD
jgi:hypothetical protein